MSNEIFKTIRVTLIVLATIFIVLTLFTMFVLLMAANRTP